MVGRACVRERESRLACAGWTRLTRPHELYGWTRLARGKEGRGEGKVAEDGTGDGTSEASGGGEGGREESTDPPPVDYGDARHLVVRMSMLRKGDYVAKKLLQAISVWSHRRLRSARELRWASVTGTEVGLSGRNRGESQWRELRCVSVAGTEVVHGGASLIVARGRYRGKGRACATRLLPPLSPSSNTL